MPKVVIDGVEIEAREGQSVLAAALDAGIHIPHFCYHPRLKIAGNCRMCLVELEKVPKLQIACGTVVRDGMVVTTNNERVAQARRGVLEFLLINHPLDCPICDQAGECKLQDYVFDYGQQSSRFREHKHTFPRQDIGQNLKRDQNRCMHCTRCIRFLRDVSGEEEFTLAERGSHTLVGPYLERAVLSPFSLCLAEVCPVGALTSIPFRFRGRAWLMDRVRTLCPGCSRGCNAVAWSRKGEVLRLTPALNEHVNLSWLCDYGRRTIDRIDAADRIHRAAAHGADADHNAALDFAAEKLGQLVQADQGQSIGVLLSAKLTNEDNFAAARLAAEVLKAKHIGLLPAAEDSRPFDPSEAPLSEWFIRDDKTPNHRGAAGVLGAFNDEADVKTLLKAVLAGELKALVVFGTDPAGVLSGLAELVPALKRLELLLVIDSHQTKTTKLAQVVIPDATPFEKDGTYTNEGGRVQRLSAVRAAPGDVQGAWRTAQQLADRLGVSFNCGSPAAVFDELAAVVDGYSGLSFDGIPPEGVALASAEEPAAEAAETEQEEAAPA
jgi:NADH-quinone oxidoreductase subunit G